MICNGTGIQPRVLTICFGSQIGIENIAPPIITTVAATAVFLNFKFLANSERTKIILKISESDSSQ
jgi:hypothetical protein